jgi:tetratricopeptide (TPR) repeat protein
MRKPLSPLQAFAEDARIAADRSSEVGDELVVWLSVAQSAEHLSALSGEARSTAQERAVRLLAPFGDARPTQRHDMHPAPSDAFGKLVEQFRVAAEAMEKAGCFELAYATVSAICRLTARADYVTSSLATLHLGRIARQLNDLGAAEDCYRAMLATSLRERDGPLAARGHIGLALISDMRGNLPAAETEFLKALSYAVPMGSTYASACQGLMSLAITGGRLADALLYGWKLYDASEHDIDVRASALSDLSVVAMRAGFLDAARSGFDHAITLTTVSRLRMIFRSGALRTAARLGDLERAREYDRQMLVDIARANVAHSAAMVLLHAAEAWVTLGDVDTAQRRLEESVALSERFGFHEYRFRAEALASRLQRELNVTHAEPIEQDAPLFGSRVDPDIDAGIGRLEALAI